MSILHVKFIQFYSIRYDTIQFEFINVYRVSRLKKDFEHKKKVAHIFEREPNVFT